MPINNTESDNQNVFAHTTSLGNLRRLLISSGKIKALKRIARDTPAMDIDVEPLPIPIRQRMTAKDAYARMQGIKDTDRVFLTRAGYLPNYGDVVITKFLQGRTVKPRDAFNSIPNEYTTGRALSLRHKAKIYVPDAQLDALQQEFPGYKFYPKTLLPVRAYGWKDRLRAVKDKISTRLGFTKEGSEAGFKRLFGHNAQLVGSEALGIALPDSSDTDVFVPYKRKGNFQRALDRMAKKYPDLALNKASLTKEDKKTFTGKVNGQDMDVVIAYGPRAEKFRTAFAQAKNRLTPDQKQKIMVEKQRLKNAWFFPGWRYKRYKKELAENLGLKEAYF